MRHRVNPWPCARLVWGVALSLAAHAAFAVMAWGGATPNEAPRPARLQVRLLERSAQLAVVAAAAGPVEAKVQPRAAVPRRRAVARVQASASEPASTPAIAVARAEGLVEPSGGRAFPQEAINGTVFALPRIGFGGPPSTARMRASTPPPAPVQFAQPDPMAWAHEAREAARAQLVTALEQQISALPTPVGSGDGSCALGAQPQPQLDCDNNALRDAVTPQAAALSGLLQAYRGMDSRAHGLSIGFNQGRYQVSLALGVGPR